MRRPIRRRLALAAPFLFTLIRRNAMSDAIPEPMTFTRRVMPGGLTVTSLRLVRLDGGAVLALLSPGAGGVYPLAALPFAATAGAGPARHLRDLELPFGVPSWDVAASSPGVEAVWTVPGSAICPLNHAAGGGAALVPDGTDPRGVYQNPRFWRGSAGAGITASVPSADGYALAAIAGRPGTARTAILPAAGGGLLLDGLLLAGDGFHLMFARLRAVSGPERTDLRGESIQPGVLRCLRLDQTFRPEDDASSPLGLTPVLEFDADISAGRVVVLATTQAGHVTAFGHAGARSTRWIATAEARFVDKLLSPAVLADGDRAAAAMIAAPGPTTARILTGEIRLPAVP